MPLSFAPTDTPLEPQKIRINAEAYNVVVRYAKENDITKFSTALNTMLLRIGRVGTKQFYLATMESEE